VAVNNTGNLTELMLNTVSLNVTNVDLNDTKRLKVVDSSLWETYLRATERHLPYGITQCCLPPNTVERAPP